jgi:serine/threonine-protein kinase
MSNMLTPNLRQIGRYTVLRELRRDRSSVSYVAVDPVLNREVILKAVQIAPPGDAPESGEAEISPMEQAFVRQAQAAGRLHHPHILTVFEAGRLHHVGYVAIERVIGRPLHELIASGWRPDFIHAASITARIADAIDYAHGQGIAHGHLGPQHVTLQTDGAPKVSGFGGWIDGGGSGEEALARTERLLPYFDSDVEPADRMRDVRAVITLTYMMLTGRAPGVSGESVRTLRPDTPPALAQLIDAGLNPAATSGPQTAAEVRDALTAFIWNERKENVAPATLAIPLAAPPREPPTHAGATQLPARPPTAQRTFSGIAQPMTAAAAQEPEPAPAPATAVQPIAQRAATVARTIRAQAVPWLRTNRYPVAAVAGVLVVGLALGILLANFAGPGVRAASGPLGTAPATAPAAPPLPAEGVVQLDIAPWGEVLVNNKPYGVSPPLTRIDLPPGRYTIEVRHGDKGSVVATIDVDPARPMQIKHRFQ